MKDITLVNVYLKGGKGLKDGLGGTRWNRLMNLYSSVVRLMPASSLLHLI
jgi:hypothetical protein